MEPINQINEFIRAHLRGLHFTSAEELPPNPIEWINEHCHGMELHLLMGVLMGLILRGASPEMCARYTLDRSLTLPFKGAEESAFGAIFAEMSARGYEPIRLARLVEMIALMVDGAMRRARSEKEGHGLPTRESMLAYPPCVHQGVA